MSEGHASKLTEADVAEIKRRLLQGERQVDVARHYNVSRSMISRIWTGERWAWVSPCLDPTC